MTIRITDLSPLQLRALTRLDDSQTHEDSVGAPVDELPATIATSCLKLAELGLVEVREGWRGSTWFRLTEKGRQVREKGWAG